ncbi:tumor necrosis factor alpha-induced protein 2-like isoform X2 [Genypterus blacodes]
MRTPPDSSDTDRTRVDSPTEQNAKSPGGKRFHLKLPKFLRAPGVVRISPTATDGTQVGAAGTSDVDNSCPAVQQRCVLPGAEAPPTETLSFEQTLERLLLSEASQKLIEREEHLFGEITERDSLTRQEEEVDKLIADRKAVETLVEQTIRNSLCAGQFNVNILTSAVKAICQEENQDQVWAQRDQPSPVWRPCSWRKLHDSILLSLVEESLDNPSSISAVAQGQLSSLQQDLCNMGRQIKGDLQWVVTAVKLCYPPELDICNLYARMYHKTFATRLRKITDFALDNSDTIYLLRWVNEFYPDIFKKDELVIEIDSAALGKLLSEELTAPLEEQYLSQTQEDLMRYSNKVLEDAKLVWLKRDELEREDGCFVSHVAIDVIKLFYGAVKSAQIILGNQQKAKMIMCQLKDFLQRFNKFQQDVMKTKKRNSIILANLSCVKLFRDFIVEKSDLFPEDVRGSCLSLLTAMKQTTHTYLLDPVHKALMPLYHQLGTSDWLKKPVFDKLLASVDEQVQHLQGLTEPCHQELMCQLQQDVTVEYVERLLRRKLKLKNKEQQEEAAMTVKEDGESLHSLFVTLGWKEAWPIDVLPHIAEVLQLQNLPSIQMEVMSLGTKFPDISERHVSALLKLKTNFSKVDRDAAKAILTDSLKQTNTIGTRPFFSRVNIR